MKRSRFNKRAVSEISGRLKRPKPHTSRDHLLFSFGRSGAGANSGASNTQQNPAWAGGDLYEEEEDDLYNY